jgi:glycosyltransferase involved in cell wall biosynthesis
VNIVIISHHHTDINSGGSGAVYQLLSEYKKLGHQARYYSFDDLPGWIPPKATPVVFPYFVAAHINQLVRRERIDVVDATSGDAWVWAMTRRKINSPLLVSSSQGLEHAVHLMRLKEARRGNTDENDVRLSWKYMLYDGGFRLWEVATSFRRADLALFLNRYDLRYAVSELGVNPERARVVANGIPDTFLNLPFEATPAAQDGSLRIALVASYGLRKGIKYAPPALNAVLTRHPQVQVAYLGTGCPADKVLIDYDPSVRGRVKVVPRYTRTELPTLLKGYQIKLFPTLMDGFGMALVEAMACGLAPIVTSTPGPLEIVQDGHDALVVPVSDSRAIERALERLITDRALLDELRRNAHAKAQAYSWSRIARQRLQLYEEFLQARMPGE